MNIITNDTWASLGFTGLKKTNGKEYHTCPQCSHTRKKNRLKCVVVNHDTGWANCFHTSCGQIYKLGTSKGEYSQKDFTPAPHTFGEKVYEKPKMPLPSEENIEKFYKYFAERGISKETLQAMQVSYVSMFMQGNTHTENGKTHTTKDEVQKVTMFPYFRNNELINAKYRSATKAFRLEKGCELILYNFDVLYTDIKTLIITEGEIDCLSFLECGITNVVSVPNGASEKPNLSYIDNAIELLNEIDTFIIATDNDKAGELLADALTRKLGREKCKRVLYPEGCKDTNEVLIKYGKEAVNSIIEKSIELQITGVLSSEIIIKETLDLYDNGYPKTYPINISSFNELFTFNLGEVTIITGEANAGKTTLINEILQRLNYYHGLKCGILSWEQQPVGGHMSRLLLRKYGKTFFAPNEFQSIKGLVQMSRDEAKEGAKYYTENFKFFDCRGISYTVDDICNIAKDLVKKYGIHILYIDPFTHIDRTKKPSGMSETDYISYIMVTLSNLAKELKLHIILVAHPTKSRTLDFQYIDLNGAERTAYFAGKNDINGSVHFENTADNILAIARHPVSSTCIVFTQKVRYQDFVGSIGKCELLFKRETGRYNDLYEQSECNYKPIKQNDKRAAELHKDGFNGYSDGYGEVPF